MCWDDNMTGQEHCVRGWLHAGDSCYDLPNNPSALCEPDLHCNLTTGMCEPNAGTLGGACPCQTGLTCGDDQKCHPGAAKGESCEQIVCGKGLRCATVATQ